MNKIIKKDKIIINVEYVRCVTVTDEHLGCINVTFDIGEDISYVYFLGDENTNKIKEIYYKEKIEDREKQKH